MKAKKYLLRFIIKFINWRKQKIKESRELDNIKNKEIVRLVY